MTTKNSLLAFSMLASAPVLAGWQGPEAEITNMTVAEARNAKDDTRVILKGYLLRHLGEDEYLFRDQSGDIKVEIKPALWRGIDVKDTTLVTLRGEVDQDWFDDAEVEVAHLALAADNN